MSKTLDGLTLASEKAISNGGKCLSTKYTSAFNKLKWECAQGHIWEATFVNVYYNDSWCQECKKKKKKTIEFANNLAKAKGGRCLSLEYKNNTTPLKWECAQGHIWETPLVNLTSKNSWCPECSYIDRGKKKAEASLDKAKEVISLKKGNLLDSSSGKLKIQCEKGHTWDSTCSRILSNKWCPECWELRRKSGILLSYDIEDLKKDASVYGGECLSKEYLGVNHLYKWKCNEGHIWNTKYSNIKSGCWCRKCKTVGKREEFCRQIFQALFGEEFPNMRPSWLKSPIGRNLELDGYCEKLSIAFEHNGIQHYEENIFKKKKNFLEKQKWYDSIKIQECEKRKISLIVIPYWIPTLELGKYIELELNKLKITFKPLGEDFKFLPGKRKKKQQRKLNGKRKETEKFREYLSGDSPDPISFLDSSLFTN